MLMPATKVKSMAFNSLKSVAKSLETPYGLTAIKDA